MGNSAIFEDFARQRALNRSSEKVYGAMWGKFEAFCLVACASPYLSSPATMEQFFAEQAWRPNTAKRYFRLLQDVFEYMVSSGDLAENPVTPLEKRFAYDFERPEPLVLEPSQEQAVLEALPLPKSWKKTRARALIALLLGSGLKQFEAIRLPLSALELETSSPHVCLRTRHGAIDRVVPMAPAIVQLLLEWLEARRGENLPGPLAFPASHRGEPLTASTVYRQVKAVLQKAGVRQTHMGSGLLRNSFGAKQFRDGEAFGTVQRRLGHRLASSTEPLYRKSVPSAVD